MKKRWIIIAVIAVLLLSLIGWSVSAYNGLVDAETTVDEKAATVDTMLTRRADLIPNLVSTVKGYAAHEEEIFTSIADARAKLNSSTTTEGKIEANNQLDSALSRLLVIVEQYPDLKASEQFKTLMDQLEGAENRISTARMDYNTAVGNYNKRLRRFPSSLIAGMFGFESRQMFEAPAGSEVVPDVNFD